jgi:hypothetical protein
MPEPADKWVAWKVADQRTRRALKRPVKPQ